MTYNKVPTFGNLDYKSDIRDKVLVPLIEQHNKHSDALEALVDISNEADGLKTLVHNVDELEALSSKAKELKALALNSNELVKVANNSEIVLGLDNRVLRLELNSGNSSTPGSSPDLSTVFDKLDDHDTRILALENKEPSVGGTDLTEVEKGIAENKSAIADQKDKVDDHESRIDALESVTPSTSKEITKWYVLPMGGQSNCVGYGEKPYYINGFDNVNPRIKQIGRYATHASTTDNFSVTKDKTNYGDRFNELRPYADCNLNIIPATPCLDMNQNMFMHNKSGGGTVSSGMYIARALLPYIPEDYGILIVPCAYGGTGFNSGSNGTWNATKIRSEGGTKHGAGLPLSKDLYYRTKYALELNEENILLPFIWVQGENDKEGYVNHYNNFKSFFDWFQGLFEADGLQRFLPEKRMDNFRFFCLGSTKWMLGANTETDYIKFTNNDWETLSSSDTLKRLSTYNNYAFLSNLYKTSNGSRLVYLRADIDNFGKFVETNRENGTGDTTSNMQIHFSTRGYSNDMAGNVANAILNHSNIFPTKGVMHTRKVLGGCGVVSTDNVIHQQNVGEDFSRITEGLVLYQNYATGTIGENQGSGTVSINNSGGVSLVDNSIFTKVANFPGTSLSKLAYSFSLGSTSWTKVVTFRSDISTFSKTSAFILAHNGSTTDGVSAIVKGSIVSFPDYTSAARTCSLLTCGAIENNWNGGFDDWQTLAITYSKESGIACSYLNGNLTQTATAAGSPTLNGLSVGNGASPNTSYSFVGEIASTRVYNRALGHEEIKALAYTDLLSKI